MVITNSLIIKNMYKANEILERCIGQTAPYIDNIKISNAQSFFGQMSYSRKLGEYTIKISKKLFEAIPDDNEAEIALLSTVTHELVHAWQWGNFEDMNHGKTFKKVCDEINRIYPELKMQRCKDTEELGIVRCEERKVKYICTCTKCNHEWEYKRKPRFYDHPQTAGCPYCNTRTIVVRDI